MFCPQNGGQLRWRFHAVLHWDHISVWSDHGLNRACGLGHLPGLHAKQDNIDVPDLSWIVGGECGPHRERPRGGFQPQPVLTDRLQMRTACDENHIFASLRQACTKIPARAADTKDCNAHRTAWSNWGEGLRGPPKGS